MTKQAFLAGCLARLGILRLMIRRQHKRLPVLAYHRILDDDSDPATLADPGLFSATASSFDAQMALVSRHFNVITLARLLDPAPLPPRPLVITFDDGYEDNYRIAYPILKKHGLHGVFFVTTGFIDDGQPLWFDQVAILLDQSTLPHTLDVAGRRLLPHALPRQQLVQQVLAHLKSLTAEARQAEIKLLERQTGNPRIAAGTPMTWAQLRHMADNGMEIGSHSRSHSVLANETAGTITAELAGSRQQICEQLQRDCVSVAYPVGGTSAVNDQVLHAARECGYGIGCTYLSGINRLPLRDPLALVRVHVELDVTLAQFYAQLALPDLFGYRH
jgi:peptidoglycan/xylan/chitin deacetylase (PgdA/CDA1 family)